MISRTRSWSRIRSLRGISLFAKKRGPRRPFTILRFASVLIVTFSADRIIAPFSSLRHRRTILVGADPVPEALAGLPRSDSRRSTISNAPTAGRTQQPNPQVRDILAGLFGGLPEASRPAPPGRPGRRAAGACRKTP